MILAIDPGGTSGIAWVRSRGSFNTQQVVGGAEGMIGWLSNLANEYGCFDTIDAVVCETFVPRPGAKSTQLDAMHIIGMLRYLCSVSGVPLIMQSPAQAKSFSTNEKLKAVGWYSVGEDHGRDAARHLLVAVCSNAHGRLSAYAPLREELLAKLVQA